MGISVFHQAGCFAFTGTAHRAITLLHSDTIEPVYNYNNKYGTNKIENAEVNSLPVV